jgi:hypothetical protein
MQFRQRTTTVPRGHVGHQLQQSRSARVLGGTALGDPQRLVAVGTAGGPTGPLRARRRLRAPGIAADPAYERATDLAKQARRFWYFWPVDPA